MHVSTIQPSVDLFPHVSPVAAAQAAQRWEVLQAARSVNDSGLLGHNQLVFLIDRTTHLPIIRVVDRETHEVVLQLPAEYVLRLARDVQTGALQMTPPADM
jgi:uncharacterized FlaG/YvyC family protein